MLNSLLLTALLAILPHEVKLPNQANHKRQFDASQTRFQFFRDLRPDGPLPSTHRLIFHRHYYYDAKGNRIEQLIPVHNNSHFYWDADGSVGYVRIHAVKVNGRYEIEKITTWDLKPIKPRSLRKPSDTPTDEYEDG